MSPAEEAPPHPLFLPRPMGGKPGSTHGPPVTGQDSGWGAFLSAFRTASTAPLPEGTVFKPKPASSCTLVPSPAQAVPSPRSQVPEMKRKKMLTMSPRCVPQPCWHSCSLRGRGTELGQGLPAPLHPWPWPRGPYVCPAPQPLCPSLPTSPQPEGTQPLFSCSLSHLWSVS